MRKLLFTAVLATVPLAAPAAEGPGYTIEDIVRRGGLTGYMPENLRWHPEGKYLAYLQRDNETHEASLYLADPVAGTTRLLLDAETLAGAAASKTDIKDEQAKEWALRYNVSSYRWSPQGGGITFISGDQLHYYDLASGELNELTETPGEKRALHLSPDEEWVAFVQDGTVRYVKADSGEGAKIGEVEAPKADHLFGWPTWVYAEEFGMRSAYKWSHDSRYNAFMAFDETPVDEFPLVNYLDMPATVDMQNYPKAGADNPIVRLGIHDRETGRTIYSGIAGEPGVYIARIGWIEASGNAYALLLNREQTEMRLVSIDPETGDSDELLEIEDDAWIDVTNDYRFLEDGRFVFAHQEDGWHHLYLYDADGDLVRKLTPGEFNVTGLEAVDEKNGWVYFSRFTEGPRNVHLYRVKLAGGDAEAVTEKPGYHGIGMDDTGTWFVDSYSNLETPWGQWLKTADNESVLTLAAPADLSGYAIQVPELRVIKAADGKTDLVAQVIVPPDFDPEKKYPVIMKHYGGPSAVAVQNKWPGFQDNLLAHEGYVIFEVGNRADGSFSHEQQSIINHNLGRIELEDQVAAADWLKRQPWVDDERIGLIGHSYGGYMTIYALENAPGVWAAGIAGAPVTQWQDYDTIYTERYMSTPEKNPEGYKASSTLTHVEGLADPLLLIHGTGDDNVHWQNTLHLIDALVEAGKPYELAIYPDKTHSLRGEKTKLHVWRTERDFWRRHLGR
ncbi:MAG TPA: DPP IV N-terminal domain-containing protein [Gammaproteobacteria bacterium]